MYSTIRIVPDSSVRNWYTADVARLIANWYKVPLDRFSRSGFRIKYETPAQATFEMDLSKERISFLMRVPTYMSKVVVEKLQSLPGWERATISIDNTYTQDWSQNAKVYQLIYRKDDAFSLETDAKNNAPLRSICQSVRVMEKEDRAKVFALLEPKNYLYWKKAHTKSLHSIMKGRDLRRTKMSRVVASVLITIFKEIALTLSELFTENVENNIYKDAPLDPELSRQALENLSDNTKRKGDKNVLGVYLWVASESGDEHRAEVIGKTVVSSFSEISADNELEGKELKGAAKKEALKCIKDVRKPRINILYNTMSIDEVGKIIQLPGYEIQQDFSEIQSIPRREVAVASCLLKKGIKLGTVTHKGATVDVYMPVSDIDDLCLPRIILGGKGTGKTKGYAVNFALESLRHKYGTICIDPAKGEIGDEIQLVASEKDVVRIQIGETPIALDWCEVKHSRNTGTRLANTIISFFNTHTDEAGAQTARYLRGAIMGMKTGRLTEILDILTDTKYRKKVVEGMSAGLNRTTLQSLDEMSEARRSQVLSPIYNRLDVIMGDPYLLKCMESRQSLDMVKLMEQRKIFIFDVPQTLLGKEGVSMIVNLLSTKIDLAMTLRKADFPFFVVLDEPHQFIKSSYIWESAVVEGRKWRVGYIWLFHSWEQMPRKLMQIIKDAGAHYHIYRSSKETYRELKEELLPSFSLEDCLKTPKYYAINIIEADGVAQRPFMAKMMPPPSVVQKENKKSEPNKPH